MRSYPIIRIVTAALALTLLGSSAATAQIATPPPEQYGQSLTSTVITNALDPAVTNETIEEKALYMHGQLGGKEKAKVPGTKERQTMWRSIGPLDSTEEVIQATVDAGGQDPTVVVISGGDNQAGAGIARRFASTFFIDLGQMRPCVTLDGVPDPSGTCEGGIFGIPGNYTSIDFAVEDGAYLAGILAARASRNGRLGIISGTPECTSCNRYVQGFVEGARSVDAGIDIELAYLADDEVAGFSDPTSAYTYTEAFIEVFEPDVLLPIGRAATIGMLEAACDAEGVLAIGTDIDMSAAYPDLQCILTSVTVDVGEALERAMYGFHTGEAAQEVTYDLGEDFVAVEFPRQAPLPVDTAERYQAAETAIRTGQIDTCPVDCGSPVDLGSGATGA